MSNIDTFHQQILTPLLQAVDSFLENWEGKGNIPVPTIVTNVANKLNLSLKEMRLADPVIRYYLNNNPDWNIVAGRNGGAQKSSILNKKMEDQKAKDQVKDEIKKIVESKLNGF